MPSLKKPEERPAPCITPEILYCNSLSIQESDQTKNATKFLCRTFEFKSDYTVLWTMNYFPPYIAFTTEETSQVSCCSFAISIESIHMDYIPQFPQFSYSELRPAMPHTDHLHSLRTSLVGYKFHLRSFFQGIADFWNRGGFPDHSSLNLFK